MEISTAHDETVIDPAKAAATVIVTATVSVVIAAATVARLTGRRGVMPEATEVGEEAGVARILADTHVVTEETEISTEAAAAVGAALALQARTAIIALEIAEIVMMTVATEETARARKKRSAARVPAMPRLRP